MYKVYFAHPFATRGTKDEQRIIDAILKIKNLELVNPFTTEDDTMKKHGVKQYYPDPTKELAQDIFNKDLNQVIECDFILAWFPDGIQCIGTAYEMAFAVEQCKFINVICSKMSPFFSVADCIYDSIESFEKNEETFWSAD